MSVVLKNTFADWTELKLRPDWANLSITHLVDSYLLCGDPVPHLLAKVLAYCPPHYALAVMRRLIELRQDNRLTQSQVETWFNTIENGIIETYYNA